MKTEIDPYPYIDEQGAPNPWPGLVIGWGFRAGARTAAFASCWAQACECLAALAQPLGIPLAMAVLADRLDTPAGQSLRQWAATAVPGAVWRPCPEQALRLLPTAHQSARVQQRFATGSVCEALALHGTGHAQPDRPPVALLIPRIVSADRHATLAVAGRIQQRLSVGR